MPRGGGGGFGRGGAAAKGTMRGMQLPWEYDPDLEYKPTPNEGLFPKSVPPIVKPPTASEKRAVEHYRNLRARIHEGPMYTTLDDLKRDDEGVDDAKAKAAYNPFEDAPTYSQRYKRPRNTLPKLSDRPYVKEMFPEELWSTIDEEYDEDLSSAVPTIKKKKFLDISEPKKYDALRRFDEEEAKKAALEAGKAGKEAGGEGAEAPEESEEEEEEAVDDDFEEDEDGAGADDYNAEQYFEDGDEGYDDAGAGDAGEDDGY
ncbi:DNA-directed RNA polymerase III subunit C31 [Elasticomyces elasticus]|nr:hypothetical protein LTR28_008672 [Elasticomyces elasticus]KAK4964481.1 DNA-directed RNA polymerase III subunit C31 [Elasticomyces elasticus]